MRRLILILTAVAMVMALCMPGCSGGGGTGPIAPVSEDPELNRADAVHHTWGLWQFIADPVAENLEIVQLRTGNLHLNALPFLEPPALVYLSLDSLEFNGNEIDAVIGLRHPFLGLNEFTGFDVCGILITNGSVTGFDDSDIVMAGENDTRLLNPDGYARWWNPAEFPVNDGTIFSYNDGLLGAPDAFGDYNSTINGYKFFCDELDDPTDEMTEIDPLNRCIFSAGQKNTRLYRIMLGDDGLVFNYAIDACWQFPNGNPPWAVPDDFPQGANRPEAWNILITESENTLYNDGAGEMGGDLTLSIDVYDHFDADMNTVKVESGGNFDVTSTSVATGGGVGYSTYEIEITDATPTEVSIDLLITVECETTGFQGLLTGKTQASYFTYTVPVDDEPPTIPDDTEWRQFRQNTKRTGRTTYAGPATNTLKFAYDVPSPYIDGVYGGIVFDSYNRAIFRANCGNVYCVDTSGDTAWSYFVDGTYDYCTAFVDADDNVYVGNSLAQLYMFDSDGNLQWSAGYGSGSISYPTVQSDGTIVFCRGASPGIGVLVKTASDGSVLWQYDTGNITPGGPSTDDDGILYVSNHSGQVHAVNQDGDPVWVTDCGPYEMNVCPALGENGIYVCDWGGYVHCLDYSDGGIIWSEWLSGSTLCNCVAIGDDGYIYVGSRDNNLYCMDASNGDVEWSFDTGGEVGSNSPVLDGAGRVYCASYSGMFYCLNTSDGSVVWTFDVTPYSTQYMYCKSPAIDNDGTLAFGTNQGYVFAIQDP